MKLNTLRIWACMLLVVLIAGCSIGEKGATTTTTVPAGEDEKLYVDIDVMRSALPESTENFEGYKDGGAIQSITITQPDNSEQKHDYSIASRKYLHKDGREAQIVVTDTLRLYSLNKFFYELIERKDSLGYVKAINVKGFDAWEHFEYGPADKDVGQPRVDVAINERLIVTVIIEAGTRIEEIYELVNAVDYKSLELLVDDFVEL